MVSFPSRVDHNCALETLESSSTSNAPTHPQSTASAKMKMAAVVLVNLAAFAAMLANLATLPLLPGYLVEGATAPTDKGEVYVAAERLWRAGAVLMLMAAIMHWARALPAAPLTLCACAAVAFTTYRAWDVIAIIVVWAGHIRGEHAMGYWVALIEPFLALLVVGVLWVLFLIVIRPLREARPLPLDAMHV